MRCHLVHWDGEVFDMALTSLRQLVHFFLWIFYYLVSGLADVSSVSDATWLWDAEHSARKKPQHEKRL